MALKDDIFENKFRVLSGCGCNFHILLLSNDKTKKGIVKINSSSWQSLRSEHTDLLVRKKSHHVRYHCYLAEPDCGFMF